MSDLAKKVLEIIKQNPLGIKAKDIARKLNLDRQEINSVLYSELKGICHLDTTNYLWFPINPTLNQNKKVNIDNDLRKLCQYYQNCITLDDDRDIDAFLNSNFDDYQYVEIDGTTIEALKTNDVASFMNKVSTGQTPKTLYLGYPVMINSIYSKKSNNRYLKVVPVFLFQIEYIAGEVYLSEVPTVNKLAIKKYVTNDNEQIVHEVLKLEDELGLNSEDMDFDLFDLVATLQNIRAWNWKETLNPEELNNECPISEITEEGIYNRCVVIASEKSPFTYGLEKELSLLANMSEDSYRNTALYDWIHPSSKHNSNDVINEQLLEVLPLNMEQYEAVKNSLYSKLSVITGPPGTGKSQVVTDLLINLAWKGKSALFSSKNNKAVDVVDTRINNLGDKPIMLRLGGSSNSENLAESIEKILHSHYEQTMEEDYLFYQNEYKKVIASYNNLLDESNKVIDDRNHTDRLEQRIIDFRDKYIPVIDIKEKSINDLECSCNEFVKLFKSSHREWQSLGQRLLWPFTKKKILNQLSDATKKLNQSLQSFHIDEVSNLSYADFDATEKRLKEDISNLRYLLDYANALRRLDSNRGLETIDKELSKIKSKLAEISAKMWKIWLQIRVKNIDSDLQQDMIRYINVIKLTTDTDNQAVMELKKLAKKIESKLSKILPIWAVTCLSAKSKIPFTAGMFDVVVIDEASQCDIASVLPLLYRAKRAVIIGDPQQLGHISTLSRQQDNSLLNRFGVGVEWAYSITSLYGKAEFLERDNIVHLRDHFRSRTEIINFSNKEFYDGALRVATNYDKLKIPPKETTGIRWVDCKGQIIRPQSGSSYNTKEIETTVAELRHLVDNNYSGSIGVVTPFRLQAEKIKEVIEQDTKLSTILYSKYDFIADTVHKFQGDERDVMIFSSVITSGATPGTLFFLKENGNLFNVAITRARSVLIVIGDINYCSKCGIKYMEHFVEYCKTLEHNIPEIESINHYGRNYPYVSNSDQVSDWERVLYTALYDAGVQTIPQYSIDKYKLDLALLHSGKKLDIEVDGERYHRDWNGELCYRDRIRNQRLYEMGWDVKRFWVYQIRDELDMCIKEIVKWMAD